MFNNADYPLKIHRNPLPIDQYTIFDFCQLIKSRSLWLFNVIVLIQKKKIISGHNKVPYDYFQQKLESLLPITINY